MTLHDLLNVALFFAACLLAGAVVGRLPLRCADCGPVRGRERGYLKAGPAESAK